MQPAATRGHAPEAQAGGSNPQKGKPSVSGSTCPVEPSEVLHLYLTAGADSRSLGHSLGLQHVATEPFRCDRGTGLCTTVT